ncbi:DUF4179 domain-containing protein [uncultured Oscillibacter sp.]|uniref:DUF4179 domain-containing protein n=1 Tax=uncultured Oscillibacter sp. TaxID=876091 RepID=UPI00261936FC|nr:DUF4179 domain-containing protein [uncultured Oscillibacter sp.]
MTQFDMLLRRALMDANLAQYERALQSVEDKEPDFSPRYLRERMRLLADPQGWGRQAGARKRLDWRLAAIVAAMLLLSACAYAVATGQFSQWFTWFGVNPNAPEQSEEVLRRTGTVIEQSQTVGDTTVTLNAAVWDGTYIYLSFTIESPSLPEDLQAYTPLHTGDCRLIMRQDQWEEYMTNRVKEDCANQNMTPEETEEAVRAALEERGRMNNIGMWPGGAEKREGNVLTFQDNESLYSGWFTETKRPELTLHLENIATYADGKGESIIDENGYAQNPGPGEIVIPGPFDLTFTLNEPILPIHYGGADVDVTLGTPPLPKVPMHFTELQLSVTGMDLKGEILAQVDMTPQEGYVEVGLPEGSKESDPLRMVDVQYAIFEGPWGLWIEDGTYVDITDSSGGLTSGSDLGETFAAFISHGFPYPIDPATITAVDIGGVRVELSELERLPERMN